MYLPRFHEFLYDEFENNPTDENIIAKLNVFLLNILNTKKENQITENFQMVYESVSKISNGEVSKISLYLHNYIFPKLTYRILEAKFPGLTTKSIELLENAIGTECITNMDNMMNKNQKLNKIVSIVKRIIQMELNLLDLVKDLCFAISLVGLIGGVTVLWFFPDKFTSVVVCIYFTSILLPLILATMDIAIYNPGMIFTIEDFQNMSCCRKFFVILGNFLFCMINPIILISSTEAMKDKIRKHARYGDFETLRTMKLSHAYEIQRAHFMKLEIGIENYIQAVASTLLLLLGNTKTGTTRGFESLFTLETTFLGIQMTPETILILSIAWSIKSTFMTHVNILAKEKGFMPIVPYLIVILWTMFGALRRVLSCIVYFIPFMGLYDILYHTQWEQIPFEARRLYAMENTPKDTDTIYLHGLTENIQWDLLDRWDYADPSDPKPPGYSLYTFFTLQQSLIAFFCLLLVQFVLLFIAKCCTARDFCNRKNKFRKFLHVLLNTNFSYPYKDWDDNMVGPASKEDYQRQYR